MANTVLLILLLVFSSIYFPIFSKALSSCNGPCRTFNDCAGQLICINRNCNDDPNLGTHICRGSSPSPRPDNNCQPSGKLTCKGRRYTAYTCSPPVTSSIAAKLILNDFEKGGDVGGPSQCGDQYHDNSDPIVALSTGWYNGESRCGKITRITAANGRSVRAKVVDDCDSMRLCDEEHADQPPCEKNIVYGSEAVWNALGLNKDLGVVDISWAMG